MKSGWFKVGYEVFCESLLSDMREFFSDKDIDKKVSYANNQESHYVGNQLQNGDEPFSSYFGKPQYDRKYYNYILFRINEDKDVVVILHNIKTKEIDVTLVNKTGGKANPITKDEFFKKSI